MFFTSPASPSFALGEENAPEFRRQLLRPQQLPAEMERVRRGVLRQLSVADFEELVARVAEADAGIRNPPRLVESRYKAALAGESLTGSATWTILHQGVAPGLLSLEPLNLALRRGAWDDGTPALLGDLDRRPAAPGMELFVGRPGEQRLILDWSVRGTAEPAGLRFEIKTPPCPLAIMELEIPADREPVVPHEEGLLSGPLAGSTTKRHLWKLAFGRANHVDLTIRPVSNASPLILVRQNTSQVVSPGETACEFTFDIEAPQGGIRDLMVECDPVLRPTEVFARNLEHWEAGKGTDEDGVRRVAIHLNEPLERGSVVLRAFGPATPDRPWASPVAAIAGAVPRGETLSIRVHPDLRLADWRAGPFRLTESSVTADRWQALILQSASIGLGGTRPAAWLRRAEPEFQVHERLWWELSPRAMTLTAKLTLEVARGPMFEVPLRLPAGWDVEGLESDPPDLVAAGPLLASGQPTRIALQRALGPGAPASFTLHLTRRSQPGNSIAFPDVQPIGPGNRDGILAIRIDPGLQASATGGRSATASLPADREPAPWGDAPADFRFSLGPFATEGSLMVRQGPAQLSASADTTATVVGREMTVVCRLQLEPGVGGAEAVTIYIPGVTGPWDWQVTKGDNRLRSVQRIEVPPPQMLAALAAPSPWSVLQIGMPPAPNGSFWRLAFARPLAEPVELEANSVVRIVAAPDQQWIVPLVRVPTAASERHQITLDLRTARGWRADRLGLTDLPATGGSPWYRSFGYGPEPASLSLTPGDEPPHPLLDRARLVTYATCPGPFVHCLSFRVWNWDRPTIPVDLPLGAAIKQVRINGVVANLDGASTQGPAPHVELPALAGVPSLAVEFVYTSPSADIGPISRLDVGAPVLPIGNIGPVCTWCLSPDIVPLWPKAWRSASDSERELGKTATSEENSYRGHEGILPADFDRGILWEPVDPSASGASVWVIRPLAVNLIGGVVGLAGFWLAWVGRRWAETWQWAAILASLGLASVAVIWLPEPLAAAAGWPLIAVVVVACLRLLRIGARPETPTILARRPPSSARVVAGVLVAAVWWGGGGRAAAPGPTIVYLVPGPLESPGPRAVLAPPDLLDRLQAASRRGPAGLDGAAWIEARYQGRADGTQARFDAVLRLHSFADDPTPLSLPLTGVRIGDATLDGAAAFLQAVGDRYQVPIHGRGPHTLVVRFTAPCQSASDSSDLRFGIPEIPNSHLTLTASTGIAHLRAVSSRGSQTVDEEGGQPRLGVDLGRANLVHVRWRIAERANPSASVRNQEAYLWDLSELSARLLGAVRFNIGPGSVTSLTFRLPNDLEVVNVVGRPLDTSPTSDPAGWLRSWRVVPAPSSAGQRRLVLDFGDPIEGQWQINLEIVPHKPFSRSFGLSFPSAAGEHSGPPVMAWRAQGVEITDVPPDGATPLAPDLFLREHWLPNRVEPDPKPPARAYRGAVAGAVPTLRMRTTGGPRDQTVAEVNWRVGPHRAEIEAAARVTNSGGPISIIEWTAPPAVAIASVQGPEVYYWSRAGSRLQIWLAKPVAEAEIRITGSVVRPAAEGRFEMPSLWPRAAAAEGSINISAGAGLTLTPVETTHLTEALAGNGIGRSYTTEGSQPHRAIFDIRYSPTALESFPAGNHRPMTIGPPAPPPAPIAIDLVDMEAALGDDNRWVQRATIWVTHATSDNLQVSRPGVGNLVAVEVDGKWVPIPQQSENTCTVPMSPGASRFKLVWAGSPGGTAPTFPAIPELTIHGEPVRPGEVLWTLLAPRGVDIGADVAPLPAATAALHRAAHQIRLAGAARLGGPSEVEAAREAWARAACELRTADPFPAGVGQLTLGPGGVTLQDWRQQLQNSIRSAGVIGPSSDASASPYDGAFSHGVPRTWYLAPGTGVPHFAWPAAHTDGLAPSLRTITIALVGFIAVWLGRRFGALVWPEQLALLGVAAFAASESPLWVLPTVAGIAIRMMKFAGAAVRRWRPAAGPESPPAPG